MNPEQLRRAAELMRARTSKPSVIQTPGDYMVSVGIHALAGALEQMADEDDRG